MTHKAKKSLGQNFLKSNLALKKIIEAGEISPEDVILEIGPGKGVLTEKLLLALQSRSVGGEKITPLRQGFAGQGCVIAVEKDFNLFNLLKEKFSKEISIGKLILLNEDILKFDIKNTKQSILEGTLGRSDGDGQRKFSVENFRGESEDTLRSIKNNILHNYKIVANIPYNITGAILKKFLTGKNPSGIALRASQPSLMVLMVQQEVAQRIIAHDKKESILSISVKAYGEPKMIMKVPARYFSPAPKVDSAVIAIKNISRKKFAPLLLKEGVGGGNYLITTSPSGHSSSPEEEKFWEIVRAGFAHKRKKLSNNLKNIIKNIPEEYKNKRAEELSLEDWIKLAKIN